MPTSLALIPLLPLVAGTVLTAVIGARGGRGGRVGAALAGGAVALLCVALLVWHAPQAFSGTAIVQHTPWIPAIGLNANFRLDPLAWMFAMLITGIGCLVIVYAAFYLSPEDPPGRFHASLMLFMAAMLGIVLSDNLLLLVVFWELTSISSFLLIGYWGSREESRTGARMALAVTGGGGLAMLGGVILLGQIAGTYDLSAMLDRGEEIRAHALYPAALALILLGCFTKSAQVPFHFWLPEAMAAPTPVSAYLHSATMVKAGLFLMLRLYPVIGGSELFETIVASTGLVTMVFAAVVAVFRHDLKGLLAYSTISHLGLVTFLIGLGSPLSAVAAVFHILNHAAFKAALFMSAGIVDHETGTRDMRRLGGLLPLMPVMGGIVIVASAAMAGLPPFNGFISKEMMLHEAVHGGVGLWGSAGWAVPLLATLGGLASAAYSLRLVHDVFFNGPPRDLPNPHPHEPPWGMKLPALLLAATCLAVGLAPMAIAGGLVQAVAATVLGTPAPEFHLALWHGVNLPLLLSAVAVGGGALAYALLQRRGRLHAWNPPRVAGKDVFLGLVDGLFALARRSVPKVETGSLQSYVAWMIASALVAGAWPLVMGDAPSPAAGDREPWTATPVAVALWGLLIVVSGAVVLAHRQRVIAVILAGCVGLFASLAFVALSAPDLAMTQLSVDVVSTILLLMGLALLPRTSPRESPGWRIGRDAVLAGVGGLGIAWFTWWMLTREFDSISWYFLEQAIPGGGGANVVNVILVDFRGYDTFGEITVLGIAAVGVLAVLDNLRVRRPALDEGGRPWSYAGAPLLMANGARLVLPLALMVSVFIFWRGHNEPGGGFIAGLITSVALVLQYMADGQGRTEALMRAGGGRRYTLWIAGGLAIAWLTGVGAFAWSQPFLTSAHGHPSVPVLGELPLATAAIFDLGVFVTVVGATMLMLSALGSASKEPAGARYVAAGAGPGGRRVER